MNLPALYVLADEYRDAAARLADLDLDEQTVADTLESLSGDLETKAQNVAMFTRSLEATAAAIKAAEQAQRQRREAIERRAAALREYIARCMQSAGVQRIEAPMLRLSFRKSSAVVIDGEDLIPVRFMRTPEPVRPTPDKKAIAEAINAGQDVPGAHIEARQCLQIG
jgi:hypothetical protein